MVLVVNNLAGTAQAVELDLSALAGAIPIEMFGGSVFPRISTAPYIIMLGPYDFYWFRLRWLRSCPRDTWCKCRRAAPRCRRDEGRYSYI